MFGRREVKHLGLSLLLGGAVACSSGATKSNTGFDFDPAGFDGFEQKRIHLLSTDCTYDVDGNMAITVAANETAYIFRRASDGVIVANANHGANECSVAVGKTTTFTGGAGDEKVIIDFYSGIYTAALTSAQGVIVNLGAGTGDQVEVRTTTANDLVTLGTTGGTSYLTLSTTTANPAKVAPDITITGAESILISTGAGNDSITGQGGAAVGGAGPLDGNISLTIYGGDGDDTIVSGATSVNPVFNALYGGAGNDFFPQKAELGSDDIYGGAGIDTVDYGLRSSAIRATLGGTTAAAAATGSITCVPKASINDNDYFVIPWAAGGGNSQRFAYRGGNAYQRGSITCKAKAGITNNQGFSITDGTNTATFEYESVAAGWTPTGGGVVVINVTADTTDIDVCATTYTAVAAALTASSVAITATDPAGAATIPLVATTYVATNSIDNTGAGLSAISQMAAAWVESQENIDASAIIINVGAVSTGPAVCNLTYAAILGAHGTVPVTATDPAGTSYIALVNDTPGTAGNQGITKVGSFTVAGMSGGAASITRDDGDIASAEGDDINAEVENVVGSSAGDTIDGSASDIVHVFLGMDGADTITGGPGNVNYLYGGKGNDFLIGGGVADQLFGGDGDDTLQGGLGNDSIQGAGVNCVGTAATTTAPIMPFAIGVCTTGAATAGTAATSDTIDYSERTNAVRVFLTQFNAATCTAPNYMGEGTECDNIIGAGTPAAASVKNIRGGAGADNLKGDARDNAIYGNGGDDTINGGLGNDALYGGAGNDTINGNDGNNASILLTQNDNDYINGGTGTNTLNGDDGLDTIDASLGTTDTVGCGLGDGDILLSGTGTVASACEL